VARRVTRHTAARSVLLRRYVVVRDEPLAVDGDEQIHAAAGPAAATRGGVSLPTALNTVIQ
jgi:hypothetical protein